MTLLRLLRNKTTTTTDLNEVIPVTGTIVSGTYSDLNIKNYAHEMFQSVYDYPYLSSSANHIFDITVGYSANSALSGSTGVVQESKKKVTVMSYCHYDSLFISSDRLGPGVRVW